VPGVIGHVGTVLGRNRINIANFSLGRREAPAIPGEPLGAVAVVSTDGLVPDDVNQPVVRTSGLPLCEPVEFR
jgi:D-3-phosphoglycerate dehydrogenase